MGQAQDNANANATAAAHVVRETASPERRRRVGASEEVRVEKILQR